MTDEDRAQPADRYVTALRSGDLHDVTGQLDRRPLDARRNRWCTTSRNAPDLVAELCAAAAHPPRRCPA